MNIITKASFLKELEDFEGKEQYLISTFEKDINKIIEYIDNNINDILLGVGKYRLIEDVKINSNSFKLNNSWYYWNSGIKIYKLEYTNNIVYILNDIKNDSIVIYNNLKSKRLEMVE